MRTFTTLSFVDSIIRYFHNERSFLPPFYQFITWRSQHKERENMDATNTTDHTAPN